MTSRVTVICLCYNQARFVGEAILSVLRQTHPDVELIVVDDASTDNSAEVIEGIVREYPDIQFLRLEKNVGNCAAFNIALRRATGSYFVDLAADDVLLPDRVKRGVEALLDRGERYGVNFTDAEWVGEDGVHLHWHSDRFPHATIPEGDVYRHLISRFFICSPTMLFTKSVGDKLGGYDASLAYEDFDFWIRSSRDFYYCYTPEALVKKRVVRDSMSHRQFSFFSPQLESTFRVCEKILILNRSEKERRALAARVLYEMRVCLQFLRVDLALRYLRLYFRNARR